jgi:zinc protease
MPTAGYVEDVQGLTVDDLMGFYRGHYAPNNAVLIVAGDTTTEAVRKLAETYYGTIPARSVPSRTRPEAGAANLPQRAVRADARVVELGWGRDYLAPSYRVGETKHAYALQVLARLFGGSETSRLWRALVVEARIALSAGAGYTAATLGLSSFGLDAQPAPGRDFAEIERAMADQMKRVLDGDVTAEEVERAQNHLLTAAIYSQDSLASGPRRYGSALSTGNSVADVEAWPQRVAAVSPADVIAAAQHVWRDNKSVTSELVPGKGEKP